MNKLTTLFFQLTILFFIGCRQNTNTHTQLVAIDSLLIHEKADSALIILNNLHPNKSDEEDLAYFHLLKTQALYKTYYPIMSDSIINLAITYYKKSENKEKLAQSYYYKGAILDDLGKSKEAMIHLKNAEYLLKNSNNYILLHHVFYLIAYINSIYQENEMALKYIRKALECTQKIHNNRLLAYDYEKYAVFQYTSISETVLEFDRRYS